MRAATKFPLRLSSSGSPTSPRAHCASCSSRAPSYTSSASFPSQVQRRPTLLLSWMIDVILSLVFPAFDSRDLCRHSMGRIFLYNKVSMSVSCRASSVASMSNNLSFFDDLGRIGGGGATGIVFVVLIGASPPRCYIAYSDGDPKQIDTISLPHAR